MPAQRVEADLGARHAFAHHPHYTKGQFPNCQVAPNNCAAIIPTERGVEESRQKRYRLYHLIIMASCSLQRCKGIMALATSRERRNNAGNKMSKLLDEEEEDDFYKTTYGGFNEIENDDDYQSEEEGEDDVDSDFSIDENDEPISDHEEQAPKRQHRLVTKAYKEPVVLQKIQKTSEQKSKKPKKEKPSFDSFERKSIRRSTAAKSLETQQRLKERTEDRKRKKGRRKAQDVWKPTQEELLEEAKITEEENLKSLEKYQKLEMEKKKTFITFSDETLYKSTFPKIQPVIPERKVCPITKMPARYIDPVTQLPYASMQAFKIFRQAYYHQLEQRGDRNNPDVARWLSYRNKMKELRAAMKQKQVERAISVPPALAAIQQRQYHQQHRQLQINQAQ
uniref:Vacuolar protein sorting-associated protein 72 homolog n=1 Tax=Timema genevievae TaxID=629358 RepID=A0A7R9PQM4_TIMGE|nr:unnamed protein product [Timema genevievae]